MTGQSPLAASPLATPEPWTLVADAYAVELLPLFEPFSRDALRLAELPRFPRIADVATGPGTLALVAAGAGASVSARDFSDSMVAQLRRRAAEARLAGIEAEVGDGQVLPFRTDAYDGAFSMFGLMFFPDRAAGFHELRRVLRPRCRAVVGSWAPYQGAFLTLMQSLSAVLPDFPFKNAGWPLSDVDVFAREMEAAGFRDVAIHSVTHGKTAPSPAELWASAQRTMAPVVLLRQRMGAERWTGIAARIAERLRGELGEGPVDVSLTAHLGVGSK
ncbi:MAG TPA: methyltransferase domain-containing protein [Dongiaceae bacterium]